jgi:LacI family transcriptional regulator
VPNKPSLRDVAKQANVSLGTVSNVLNRPTNVSEETRKKVREAIDMLGFIPHSNTAQANSSSKIVGLILPLAQNPFYDELAQGIEDSLAKDGYRVLIGYSREDEAIELQLLTSMSDANFRGIIVTPVGPNNQVLKSSLIEMFALVIFHKLMKNRINVLFLSTKCAVGLSDLNS